METRQKRIEDNQKEILDSIATLQSTVNTLQSTVEALKDSVEICTENSNKALEQVSSLSAKQTALQRELEQERLLTAKLSAKLETVSERLVRLESQSRRDNLLFEGIDEVVSQEDTTSTLRQVLKTKLGMQNADSIQIVRCHRLGKKLPGTSRPRTIIVKFHWYGDRMAVWGLRKNLKGTNIFMNEDFPREIQERRRILTPIMKKARDMDKTAFLNVDSLIIEDSRYTVADLCKLPDELSPATVATPEVAEGSLAFFSGQSPLSNFSRCSFTHEGQSYNSSEKLYQKQKAEFYGDMVAAQSILKAETPLECYKIGKFLDDKYDVNKWHQKKAKEAMYTALKTKFTQSPYHKQFLLSTQDKTLIEANPKDTFWSCGLGLKHRDIANEEKWTGLNVLGELLMRVRSELV